MNKSSKILLVKSTLSLQLKREELKVKEVQSKDKKDDPLQNLQRKNI
jgi:hypothetical protein